MKKKALLLALILSTASSFSQTYFTEFFTGGLTANNPWVVQTPIDNGYEWDWTEFSGNGYALVTNFEAGTNYETESWLISPSIALTDASNPILSFSNTIRFTGGSIELKVSSDYSGDATMATWTDFTVEAGFDTEDGVWTMVPSNPIDLSSFNGETIVVAFKYFAGSSSGSTYQIDNIRVEEDLCANAIFCDQFDGASLTGNNAWTIHGSVVGGDGNTYTWYHNTFSGASNARITNYINSTQTNLELESWLVTPAINLSTETSAYLSFDNAKRFEGDNLAVLISTDYDGTSTPSSSGTWTDITSQLNMDSDIESWFFENSGDFDMSDYVGENTVFIAFKYIGSTTDGSTYQLDNILVSSTPITPVVSIYDIQYTENVNGTSPLVDQTITTQGIVTATYSGGYFIQDEAGAWNGIEVFNSANSPQIGDELKITGKVVEFNGITQISFVSSYQVISSQNDLPEAPVVDNMTASSEAYESVLIRVENVVCTSGVNGFGEWTIQDQSAAMTVDDKLFAYTPAQGTMYNVTGIGYFGFNVYRILPRFSADIEAILNLSEEQLDNLSIYPNPAVNELTIQGAHGANYAILDAQGKIISSDVLTNDTQTIDVTNLESGIYFINFEGVKTYKFVIK